MQTTKHSRAEFNALTDAVTEMANQWPADELVDRLIKCMLQRFSIDLQRKGMEYKKQYRLKWHPERALAFATAVQETKLNHTSHAGIVCLKLFNEFNQNTTI